MLNAGDNYINLQGERECIKQEMNKWTPDLDHLVFWLVSVTQNELVSHIFF